MPVKPTILFTFDYEMFSHRPGTVENNMIIPTEQILQTCESRNIKVTFFVEAVFILKLKEQSLKHAPLAHDYALLVRQLQKIVRLGHRIELHLHPYWLDAITNGRTWTIPSYRYNRLQSMPSEKAEILFNAGIELLEKIARKEDSTYKIKAFRAGGWCLQPFDILKKCFEKHGIIIDSSVAPGIKIATPLYIADFSNISSLTDTYFFNDNPAEPTKNGFLEIPITTFKRSASNKILNKIKTLSKNKLFNKFGDGQEVPMYQQNVINKAKSIFSKNPSMLTLEGKTDKELLLQKIISLTKSKNILTFISHPKNMSTNSIEIMKYLSDKDLFQFQTLTDIAKRSDNA